MALKESKILLRNCYNVLVWNCLTFLKSHTEWEHIGLIYMRHLVQNELTLTLNNAEKRHVNIVNMNRKQSNRHAVSVVITHRPAASITHVHSHYALH